MFAKITGSQLAGWVGTPGVVRAYNKSGLNDHSPMVGHTLECASFAHHHTTGDVMVAASVLDQAQYQLIEGGLLEVTL